MTLTKKVIVALVILTVVGGGYYYFTHRSTGPVVQTETVKRGDVAETVSVTGELVPAAYIDLSFPVNGVVEGVKVTLGETVERGSEVVVLSQSVLKSQLQDARLAAAIAVQTEQYYLRNKENYDPEERRAKKLASEQAREKIRTIQAQMKGSVILAPMDGQISKLDIRAGEVVTLGQVVARIIKPGDYVLESRVPESDIAKIAVGMKAKITFDSLSNDEVFEGEVQSIDPAATVVQDVVSYKVKFRLSKNDDRLKEGMTGNIDIETAKRTGVLWVPYRALTKEGTKTYAEVKRSAETFERVEVTTGLEGDEGTVEVKSGLKEGDEVTIGATQKK